MSGIYQGLLKRIEGNPLAVTQGRVSIPTWEKLSIVVRSLAGART
jgi:phytoene synthase